MQWRAYSSVERFCLFTDLRRRARLLENQIDLKLVALNKLTSGTSGRYETLLNEKAIVSSKQKEFDSLSSELEGMLAKLTQIDEQMTQHISKCQANSRTGAWASGPALQHTLRRHREILRDYCTEYHRSHDNIRKKYPLLNSVMQKIQMRKRRDSVILAAVISACFILIFVYTMRS
ncbi:unnamed protein product [Gongylonema pulchrum]|uniref:Golgi SNAP receptor complex member 1 n=1 Tax=Gongylonema pulchrum TaxID=637853 RepID=A0A183DU09_9BILA|nr:unnamed protein product [Gongylonema pulchrum]